MAMFGSASHGVNTVLFDTARRRVSVGQWTRRADRVDVAPHGDATALVVLARDRKLLLSGRAGETSVFVELWAGEPDRSDGLSVLVQQDTIAGIVRIPLCACGERGCGNSGVQLAANVEGVHLEQLVDLLEALPVLPGPPVRDRAWGGEFDEDGPVV